MRFYVHQPMRFELMEEIVFQSINSSLVSCWGVEMTVLSLLSLSMANIPTLFHMN
jgi:hypothetical protein